MTHGGATRELSVPVRPMMGAATAVVIVGSASAWRVNVQERSKANNGEKEDGTDQEKVKLFFMFLL